LKEGEGEKEGEGGRERKRWTLIERDRERWRVGEGVVCFFLAGFGLCPVAEERMGVVKAVVQN
jgi:hypothetical protein